MIPKSSICELDTVVMGEVQLTCTRRMMVEQYLYGLLTGLGIAAFVSLLWMRSLLREESDFFTYEIPGFSSWFNGIMNQTLTLRFIFFIIVVFGILLGISRTFSSDKQNRSATL